MKRFLPFLLLASSLSAGPLDWAKHHKRFLLIETAAVGAASFHAYELHRCRRGGVEHCEEGYGAAWAAFGADTAFSTVVFPSIAEACWKNDGGKPCYAIAYFGPSYQFGYGVQEAINVQKPDLRKVELISKVR